MKKIVATLALTLACFGFSATSAAMADDVLVVEETPDMVQTLIVECESWQVPGWLDEQGNPTSCVDNAPCPEARKGLPCPADIPGVETVTPPIEPSEAPVAPTTPVEVVTVTPVEAPLVAPVASSDEIAPELIEVEPVLAETGISNSAWIALLIGSLLTAVGIAIVVIRSQK